MTLNEKLTLVAIVLGPISAVLITLGIESWRSQRDRRRHIVRLLLATRHLPADAQYNTAINLIPAEFNDQKEVMAAWRTYHERVRGPALPPGPAQDAHMRLVNAAQSTLIFQIMRSAGLKLSEGDIQTTAYVSEGFLTRDNLYLDSLRALPEMAATMKAQVALTQQIVNAIPNRPPPPEQDPPPTSAVPAPARAR